MGGTGNGTSLVWLIYARISMFLYQLYRCTTVFATRACDFMCVHIKGKLQKQYRNLWSSRFVFVLEASWHIRHSVPKMLVRLGVSAVQLEVVEGGNRS